jgi:phage-related protein (TIGR01555 family)
MPKIRSLNPAKIAKAEAKAAKRMATSDSFQNFAINLGMGTANANSAASYGFNPVSRNRLLMEWTYRGSWLGGAAVDMHAEDMTREGVDIDTDENPEKIKELHKYAEALEIRSALCNTIKWARLYGGAIGFLMIDGQNPATPLRPETVRKDQFKGILPIDRWALQPSLQDLVEDYGPNFGQPRFYETTPDTGGMPRLKIHYTRCIRMVGVELPYWQRITENLWGQSVLERLWDRLIAFDSTTTGAAQLVYKAHLRTYSVEHLRDIIATGGQAMAGLLAQIQMIAQFQSSQGVTLMDASDKFETHSYSFGGLSDTLLQFGQQISGALQVPLVRLFGQSPAGLNSTGESDLRTYYDGIKNKQETLLRPGLGIVYRLLYLSKFGKEPPEDWTLSFRTLWQLTAEQAAEVANHRTDSITKAYDSQIIDRAQALRELKMQGKTTGSFATITDEDIEEAENDEAPGPGELGLEEQLLKANGGQAPPQAGEPGEAGPRGTPAGQGAQGNSGARRTPH